MSAFASALRVTAPTWEPITPEEAKAQAHIFGADSDDVIAGYITTAREEAEQHLNAGIPTQTWRADFPAWQDIFVLPKALQLQSVTHVKYYDGSGTLTTLDSSYYETDTAARPARVVRAANKTWPALHADRRVGLVQITYVVGWASAALVPERIKHGIKMYVTYLHADRDGAAIFGNVSLADKARESAQRCWSDRVSDVPVCDS